MASARFPLVRVTWLDPTGPTVKWTKLEKLARGEPTTIVSIGHLIRDDDILIILPHLSADDEGFGEIVIPKGVVVSKEILAPPAESHL